MYCKEAYNVVVGIPWLHINLSVPLLIVMCVCFSPLSLLQVITLEGWVDIMYYVMDAHSFYNFIYFILLIIVSRGVCGRLRYAGAW